MKMDTTIKRKKSVVPAISRTGLVGIGTAFIILAIAMLGVALWEGFGGAAKMKILRVPGFHEVKLDQAGLYVGAYQHTGQGTMPVRELSRLDVRVTSKDEGTEVPVLMNTTGQAVSRLGFRGMPVFNFIAPRAGNYTISAIYLEGMTGPNLPVLFFHQGAGDIKQTLAVGSLFFVVFTALGIWILVKSSDWGSA